jgi:aminopeptidase N
LTLLSIQLNGKDLTEGKDYTIIGNQLTIPASVLGNDKSKISTKVEIVPEKNTRLSGLFKSGNMYITQCEAEG